MMITQVYHTMKYDDYTNFNSVIFISKSYLVFHVTSYWNISFISMLKTLVRKPYIVIVSED